MMKSTIRNDLLSVEAVTSGAELCSIRSASGQEYLWQADPAVWPRHAPILFPIVGKLRNGCFSHAGKSYKMGQHGFARDMEFDLVRQNGDSVSFLLKASQASRSVYPFEFELEVSYRLRKMTLDIFYAVRNAGKEIMPFSIGAHPGFSLNWCEGDSIEDYFLEFEKVETAKPLLIGADHLLSEETVDEMKDGRILPLRKDIFKRDALLFLAQQSHKVALKSKKSPKILTVHFDGFPDLGIWAKPGARFVCIEPWFGHLDPHRDDDLLLNKPGIIKLQAGKEFRCVYSFTIQE